MPRREGLKCTDAQIAATRRYEAKKQPLKLLPTPEQAQRIKAHAKEHYNSVTEFVVTACNNQIETDTKLE